MPVFRSGQGLETAPQDYRVAFAIVHTGPTTDSGHYQSVLSNSRQHFLSDDGTPARKLKASEIQWMEENLYLVGLLRHRPAEEC